MTDEEDQPVGDLNAVSIDRRTLLMLVQTVKELKEGVKRGQESRAGSPAPTKAPDPTEDVGMQEEEGFD